MEFIGFKNQGVCGLDPKISFRGSVDKMSDSLSLKFWDFRRGKGNMNFLAIQMEITRNISNLYIFHDNKDSVSLMTTLKFMQHETNIIRLDG